MTRLFIENKELDLTSDLSQQITYAIDDIRNIDSKATTFSRTIILPGTANNNNLFGQIFEFNHANFVNDVAPNVEYNFNAAKSAQCRLLADSVQVLKGSLRLLQIVVDGSRIEYEICIFGELGGFITKLGALKLQDLDFSDYDHEYSIGSIGANWESPTYGSGYCYPLIDYGNYGMNSKSDWKVGTLRPALFVKEYLEKIVEGAGYTMDFPLKETDRFKRLIIPYNRKILTANNTKILKQHGENQIFNDGTSTDIIFSGGTGSLGAFTELSDGLYRYDGATTVTTTVKVVITYTYTGFPDVLVFRIRKNGTTIYTQNLTANGTINYTFTTQFSTTNTIEFDFLSIINGETLTYLAKVDIDTDTAIPTPVLIGDDVIMNDTIPQNILQKDFFISIIKLFNLYVDEDTNVEKKLVIKPFVDYYVDVTDDYSDRVDRSQPMIIKPMSELNSRYYQFKYKNDSDYWNELYRKRYNEGYGDRIYDSEYEFASETQTSELIFAPTPLVGYSGEDKIYSTILKRTGNEPSVTEEQIDSVIRILQIKLLDCTTFQIYNADGLAILGNFNLYLYAGHFDDPEDPAADLNFGATKELFFAGTSTSVNQFNVYYSPYMAEITDKDSRLLTCSIKFNQLQIHNLDFSRYIWIDGGLYRLMRIIDYTPGTTDVCKVELLRVINKTYAPEEYSSVTICSQVWMDKNWDGTTFRNGDTIPEVTDQLTWEALTTPAWCYYDNDAANGAIYGKLYNWYAVSDSRGLAPVGWRVPTTNDFQTLVDCLGGIDGNGGKLKETGTTHWNAPNTGATNDSGWTGLGGGLRLENNFSDLKDAGIWWSQTAFDSINAYDTFLQSTNADVNLNNQFPKFYGLSVRLLKDI